MGRNMDEQDWSCIDNMLQLSVSTGAHFSILFILYMFEYFHNKDGCVCFLSFMGKVCLR